MCGSLVDTVLAQLHDQLKTTMIRKAPSAKVSWKLLNDTLLLRLAAGQFFCVPSGNRAQRLKVTEHLEKDPRSKASHAKRVR